MQPVNRSAEEHGFALALAVIALVVISALVSAVFLLGMYEVRLGRSTIRSQQAFAAAEEGAYLQLVQWSARSYNRLTVGLGATFEAAVAGGAGGYRVTVRRLSEQLFLVESEGFAPGGASRRRLGLLVRLRPRDLALGAAFETTRETVISGSVRVNGADSAPLGWGCGASTDSLPEIRIDQVSKLSGSPASWDIVEGTRAGFDGLFEELRSQSTITLPSGSLRIQPVTEAGACSTSVPSNWGDPHSPAGACGAHFPVVYVDGDVTLNGGAGQGVLLVDGDLTLGGGFDFYGAVMVRGSLRTQGAGGSITGGAIVMGGGEGRNWLEGPAAISFSGCVLRRALIATAAPDILPERSWLNLY